MLLLLSLGLIFALIAVTRPRRRSGPMTGAPVDPTVGWRDPSRPF